MVLSWFDASEAKQFGHALAQFFMEKTCVEESRKSSKAASKKQIDLLFKLEQQVNAFKSRQRLNIYKKAQFGNAFKWTLKEAGFDPAYVDELTSWVMLRI